MEVMYFGKESTPQHFQMAHLGRTSSSDKGLWQRSHLSMSSSDTASLLRGATAPVRKAPWMKATSAASARNSGSHGAWKNRMYQLRLACAANRPFTTATCALSCTTLTTPVQQYQYTRTSPCACELGLHMRCSLAGAPTTEGSAGCHWTWCQAPRVEVGLVGDRPARRRDGHSSHRNGLAAAIHTAVLWRLAPRSGWHLTLTAGRLWTGAQRVPQRVF